MKQLILLPLVLMALGCSRYDVDRPELEAVPTLNALFMPGERLEIGVHPTGSLAMIDDTLDVERSILYEGGFPVDTFLYRSKDTIRRDRFYRLEVELKTGEMLSASCQTLPALQLEQELRKVDSPIVEGFYRYQWEYKVFINSPLGAGEKLYLLYRPITTDTIYGSGDSTNPDVYISSWSGSTILPWEMAERNYFTLPGDFSDTLTFLSTIKGGVVRFAAVSPVFYEALKQGAGYEEMDAKTFPVSVTNVEGGTGIVSLFDTQVAR